MAESVYVNFPSQAVPDLEKISPEYGLKIGKAICQEWFKDSHNKDTTHHIKSFTSLDYMLEESKLYKSIKTNYLSMVICLILI